MPILVPCKCGKQLRVKDELLGKRVRCPECQAILTVSGGQELGASPKAEARTPNDAGRPGPKPPPARSQAEDVEPQERPKQRRVREEDEGNEFDERVPPRAPSSPQTVLRSLVLAFGILGGLAAGFLGFKWNRDANDPTNKTLIEASRKLLEEAEKGGAKGPRLEEAKAQIAKYDKAVKASYILMAGLPVGIAAGVLGFLRISPIVAGVLMLAAMAGPAVLAPPSLVFTCPFLVGGILAFLVKSKPRAARPQPGRLADEEEAEG